MTTTIATLHSHPADSNMVLIRTPPSDSGELMRGFEPATYSTPRKAYILHTNQLAYLRRWLTLKGCHLSDERRAEKTPGAYPSRSDNTQHDCSALGCRDKAVSFKDWAARNSELADQLRAGAKWNLAVASVITRSNRRARTSP